VDASMLKWTRKLLPYIEIRMFIIGFIFCAVPFIIVISTQIYDVK
jgi:hypothetical protein